MTFPYVDLESYLGVIHQWHQTQRERKVGKNGNLGNFQGTTWVAWHEEGGVFKYD